MSASEAMTWRPVSTFPVPGRSEIQVWRINLAAPPAEVDRLLNSLSAEEREQAARFHFAPDQRRFVVRRVRRRQLLSACLGIRPETLRLEFTGHRKPVLHVPGGADGLRFNCSYSADLALIAISRGRELGVDVEQHRDLADAEALAKAFFSEREIRELAELPQASKLKGFFDCWTRKEAFVKAVGLGLTCPLNRFSVSLAPGRPAAVLEAADELGAAEKWTMISLATGPDFSAALVFEGPAARINLFNWNAPLGGLI